MNRRDIIKSALLTSGIIASGALSACSKDETNLSIKPKQTEIYKISCPMPFKFSAIDDIDNLNKSLKKSKITTVYNSIPLPLAGNLIHFQSPRGENKEIKTFDDFAKYAKYAQSKNLEFVYVLNSPKPFLEQDFEKNSKELFNLLDKLEKINCKKLKIANPQLFDILQEKFPKFELEASTSLEYHSFSQYCNFLNKYPNIKTLNLTLDENKNFKLLKNLKSKFPKLKIELMVNEVCMFGCPYRITHPCITKTCMLQKEMKEKAFETICQSRHIYPWELEYYSAIGINNFKFMKGGRANLQKINFLSYYLNIVENGANEEKAKEFFEKILPDFITPNLVLNDKPLNEIIPLFPNINHFIKNGHKCSSICNSECFYCLECAKKIKEKLT